MKLDLSIPSNNLKIIELYNRIESGALNPSPDFQRKLVWKPQHKYNFIKTILDNFPFPEIYIAPDEINIETLTIKEMIVDGQQRCNTIVNYIKGNDVFSSSKLPLPSFADLTTEEKESFLNYPVSVRDLKNVKKEQIIDIFQRINSTDYALNKVEKDNAKWGNSEFLLFAKQIVEDSEDLDFNIISYKISEDRLSNIKNIFIKQDIFTDYDFKRMQATQYMMTLISTLIDKKYSGRNSNVNNKLEEFNDEFVGAAEVEETLSNVTYFITNLNLDKKSYWFNKANIFSLIVELSRYDLNSISKNKLFKRLQSFEDYYNKFKNNDDLSVSSEIKENLIRYFEYAKEAVNETKSREYRGSVIKEMIASAIEH